MTVLEICLLVVAGMLLLTNIAQFLAWCGLSHKNNRQSVQIQAEQEKAKQLRYRNSEDAKEHQKAIKHLKTRICAMKEYSDHLERELNIVRGKIDIVQKGLTDEFTSRANRQKQYKDNAVRKAEGASSSMGYTSTATCTGYYGPMYSATASTIDSNWTGCETY